MNCSLAIIALPTSSPLLLSMKTILLSLFCGLSLAAADKVPDGYKLVYSQDFEKDGALKDFVFTDPKAWAVSKDDQGNTTLELVKQSEYKPEVRSPVNISLLKDKALGDFVLEADLLQTGKEYGHRDMCLFFNFQDPKNFYYTHIATKADPNAHNIFRVQDAPRTNIATKTTAGVQWGLNVWHKVRLERDTKAGTIKVYFDDLTAPLMIATDKNFPKGFLGFGSFDDTGRIDNIRVWAPAVEQKKIEFFTAPD